MANAAAAANGDRINVYVSYARADAGFADQLCAFLEEAGFRALSDHEDIASADAGRERLRAMIGSADSVVFVLTDASVRSGLCGWEIEEAQRLAKRIVPVLPQPLRTGVPASFAEAGFVRFYSEPELPQSGFFDGQKRLIHVLCADLEAANSSAPAAAAGAGVAELRSLRRELKKARDALARIKREERSQRRTEMSQPPPYPPLPPLGYDYPPPRLRRERRYRFPWLRGGFLLLVGAWVVGFLVSGDVRAKTQSVAANAAAWMQQVYAATEPPRPHGVSADDFTPTREASAGANGANVRDYPLPHATLLIELPAHAPLHITGRLNVQGEWWFRVVLTDGRIGFVHQSAIAWGRAVTPASHETSARSAPAAAPAPNAPSAPAHIADVTPVDPAVLAEAGRAGAKIRTSPARSARVIVRISQGADVLVIGKRRLSGHWWYRVRLEDGREGYARDDVLTAHGGGRLRV